MPEPPTRERWPAAHSVTAAGELAQLAGVAAGYACAATAPATRRAYRHDWRTFDAWCAARELAPLPATGSTVALYVADLAKRGRKVAGIERALCAISRAHQVAGFASPRSSAAVRQVMRGVRRSHGVAPKQKAPVLLDELRAMLRAQPDSTIGVRDRALLLVGFAGAFRRAELVAIDVEDLELGADGFVVTVRRSKTDQEGEGRKVGIPFGSAKLTCPVRAVRAWLDLAAIERGAIFRSVTRHGHIKPRRLRPHDVARAVKRAAARVGLDTGELAGHSLRAGLCTVAAQAGKTERSIMAHTGHRSVMMVRRYIRDAELFDDNPAAGIGL